jgi:uncharacterized protein YyaL (SSP411 family)
VDKTIYVGWNAMCVSAYLDAARVLEIPDALHFALRSLDRLLSDGWSDERGLKHVIAYSDPKAQHRDTAGVLDDYAFTVIACLDAYEATGALSYYRFARSITDTMIARFFDADSGGFFDTATTTSGNPAEEQNVLGILGTRRKPFQDSPTPAGNPAAAIALLHLHAYAGDSSYREQAERTLEVFASAEKYGMFAATYALAVVHCTQPHTQVIIVGQDEIADQLRRVALNSISFSKAVVRFSPSAITPQNLPPVLAETIPSLPALRENRSFAVVCSGSTCQAPVFDSAELSQQLESASRPAA